MKKNNTYILLASVGCILMFINLVYDLYSFFSSYGLYQNLFFDLYGENYRYVFAINIIRVCRFSQEIMRLNLGNKSVAQLRSK